MMLIYFSSWVNDQKNVAKEYVNFRLVSESVKGLSTILASK
jgi:hypothetical protein